MEFYIIIAIVIMAFICEYIDSSLGMGYGTILTPVLIIVGFDLLLVLPAILFSQAVASFSAALFHQRYGNVDFNPKREDGRVVIFMAVGALAGIIQAQILGLGPGHAQQVILCNGCWSPGKGRELGHDDRRQAEGDHGS